MDEAAAETRSEAARGDASTQIGRSRTAGNTAALLAHLQLNSGDPVSSSVSVRTRITATPRSTSPMPMQAAWGCPSRDYYVDKDAHTVKLRAQYQQHVRKSSASSEMRRRWQRKMRRRCLRLETQLARACAEAGYRRDPYKLYHMYERTALPASRRILTGRSSSSRSGSRTFTP